jgi:hypothetical protein
MEEGLLLTREALSIESRNIGRLLEFFGVPWRAQNIDQFLTADSFSSGDCEKARVFCSSDVCVDLFTLLENTPEMARRWQESVHSMFVYGGERPVLQRLLSILTGNQGFVVTTLWRGSWSFAVRDDPELCGVMAGVAITVSNPGSVAPYAFKKGSSSLQEIISAESSAVFAKAYYRGVPVYLSSARELINISRELVRGIFDIREHLFSALPLVLYINWAFPVSRWRSAESSACVVIDDPLLRPSHGFINFREFLSLMKRHNFTTNIAFIPGNWRRTEKATARLFRENRAYYSISVHGCDHAHAEFASTDLQLLYMTSQEALARMAAHERATGIEHEPVMVFPHGALSEAALIALRHTSFIAAAGNESISQDVVPRAIRIADVWNTAVMCYSNFAVYTRRSPHEGVENVAFDLLLGKPALISIHHDFCRNDYKHLIDFVERINSLKTRLHWRSLAEAIKRSYRRRETLAGVVEVEMFANTIRLDNNSTTAKRFAISKCESDPSIIREIHTRSRPVTWTFSDDRVYFEIELGPNGSTTAHLRVHQLSGHPPRERGVTYKVGTTLRRYACELRDNYLVTNRLPLPSQLREALQTDSESIAATLPGLSNGRHPLKKPSGRDNDATAAISFDATENRLAKRVSEALTNFAAWLSRYGETSWDHQSFFAGPVGGRAKSLYYRNNAIGTMAVAPMIFSEAFLPSARRLFHHRLRFPIADAHYAMGFAFLYQATGEHHHFERATHFLEALKQSRSPGLQEYGWGYPFDWITRDGTITAGTPLITTTPYVWEAFRQLYQLEPRKAWRDILESIARHAANDIPDFETSANGSCCGYTPFATAGGVVNAAAYRAFLLTSASRIFAAARYGEIAQRNLNFVLETQRADGSWFYAMDQMRDFVDHYHTCFVMKALAKIRQITADERILLALERGMAYYLDNLFDSEGLPKPFSRAPRMTVYKRELYDCAECINLCLLLRPNFPQLGQTLQTLVEHILDCWIRPDGSFRSRRLHFGWDNVPMHRWAQSQIFRSLAYYLREAPPETPRTTRFGAGEMRVGETAPVKA